MKIGIIDPYINMFSNLKESYEDIEYSHLTKKTTRS